MIEIKTFEYSKSNIQILDNSREVFRYLESDYFKKKTTANITLTNTKYVKNNGPWIGVISFKNYQFQFIPKIDKKEIPQIGEKFNSNYFFMLSFLNNFDSFLFDPNKASRIEGGDLFLDILAKVFINQFKDIIKKGLLKEYIKKIKEVKFLKGKLLIKDQINKIIQNKFTCQYEDLTFDNLENQVIRLACVLLISKVKNSGIRSNLISINNLIRDKINLNKFITPSKIKNITLNRKNAYYSKILETSRYIIAQKFISSNKSGNSMCCNFIVNMAKVYEDFVTSMFKELLKKEEYKNTYFLKSQVSSKKLVKSGKLFTTIPDLIICDNKGKELFIIDIKYKVNKIPNADFYQACCYSLAYPNVKNTYLLYEKKKEQDDYSEVRRDINKDSATIKINYLEMNLQEILSNPNLSQKYFKERVLNKLQQIFESKIIKE